MFVYLSFLRPPPLQAKANTQVSIAAQIANDLRTELWESHIDVYYHWVSPTSRTRNVKLFTWKPEGAYKVISVVPPPITANNRKWALCLNTRASMTAGPTIDLLGLAEPLPVLSIPIQFETSAGKSSSTNRDKKTEEIERVYRFDGGSHITIREKTAFDLDKKIWDSGLGLSTWLAKLLIRNSIESPDKHPLFDLLMGQELCAIELGAGTGIVSIVLASLLQKFAHPSRDKFSIWATDLVSALEVIDHNIAANTALFPDISLRAVELDWERELPGDILPYVDGSERHPDLIILADVTYNTDYFEALVSTMDKLLSPNTLILLAYKERDAAERDFWTILKGKGIILEQLESITGVGGTPVEIWVGRKDFQE